jgi:hypothetical protein
MSPEEIVAKFVEAADLFEPIQGQPSDVDITLIREVLTPILLQIPYDEAEAQDNLIGIILGDVKYTAKYGQAFSPPQRVGAYDNSLADDAKPVVRAKGEARWRAKRLDRNTFETARRETTSFILKAVEDTWVRELKDPETFYTDVSPRDLIDHLQAQCTGRHAIDILALQDEMRQYHIECEGIPEYINALEDAQRRAKRAGDDGEYVVTDATLLLIASTAMLKTQQFPRVNDEWEDLPRVGRTWLAWKAMYKRAQAKARVKKLAADGQDQFGGVAAAAGNARQLQFAPVTAPPPPTTNDLAGYFDNLAAAATNEKAVLDQLVASNATLTTTNAEMVDAIKSLQANVQMLRQELLGFKLLLANGRGRDGGRGGDRGTGGGRPKKLCPNCKREVYHLQAECFELESNKGKRPAGWRSCM